MSQEDSEIPDVSDAYRRWSELWSAGLRLALSTSTNDPAEEKAAWERLLKGQARALAERDRMWERIAARWRPDRLGD